MNAISVSLFVDSDSPVGISSVVLSLVDIYGLKTWGDFDTDVGVTGWIANFGLAGVDLTPDTVDLLFSNIDLPADDMTFGWVHATPADPFVLDYLT